MFMQSMNVAKSTLAKSNSLYGSGSFRSLTLFNTATTSIKSPTIYSNNHLSPSTFNTLSTKKTGAQRMLEDFTCIIKPGALLSEPNPDGQNAEILYINCIDPRNHLAREPHLAYQFSIAGGFFPNRQLASQNESLDETLKITSNVNEMIIQGHYDCKAIKTVLSELGYIGNPDKDSNTAATCPQQPLHAAKEILENILTMNNALPDSHPDKLPAPLLQAIAAKKPITDEVLQLQLIERLTKQLILKAVENTLTHPELAERIVTGELTVYGWYYNFKSNCIEVYRPNLDEWCAWDPLHDGDFHEWYNAPTPPPLTALTPN